MTKFIKSMLMAGLMLSNPLMAFEPFVIKDIRVEGVQRLTPEAVLQELPIHVGEQLTDEKSNETIHALFQTGFYKDVALERDGNTLIVKLSERPSIGKLEITGLRNNDEVEKILKANGVVEGRIYDPNVMAKVEREIIRNYLSQQRYAVRVDIKVTQQNLNRVAVDVHVYEGTVATIQEIRFTGNKAFSDETLKDQMFHKTRNLFSWFSKSDHYSKEKLQADLEMLRSYYMDRGYLSFRIESTQVSLSADKKHVYLTINLYEGPQFYFKNTSVGGDLVIDKHEIQKLIDDKIKSGAVFSRRAIWDAKDAVEERLGEEGYSAAFVRVIDEIDQEKRLVSLRFYIDARKRNIVRKIKFEGNTLTEDRVLRRELEQYEGSWISTKKIRESKESIMRKGYSKTVDIETVPVPDTEDQVDLIYKIEEQRNAELSAGLSYSAAESVSFNLGANLKNALGTGKDVNFMLNHGKAVQTYSLGYTNLHFTETGIGVNYNLYNTRSNLSKNSQVFDYTTDSTGLNMTWMFKTSQFAQFNFGGGYDHTILKMPFNTAPPPMQDTLISYNYHPGFKEVFLNASWVYNSMDSYLFPNKGLLHSISAKASVPITDLRLYRVDYEINWFKPIYNPFVFNIGFSTGYQDSYSNKTFPFYKNYYLGGADNVRGYKERSLGPQTALNAQPFGGNFVVQARAQILFPPPLLDENKSIRMALFLDAGQVYSTIYKTKQQGMRENPSAKGLRYSSGLAVTWNTPMNIPISFSYAWPLNAKYGDRKQKFTFSMGTQI